MQNLYFHNLIDKDKFEALSTPEKIRWCLEKDVFYYAPKGEINYGKPNCVDLNTIDFSKFEEETFSTANTYRYDNDTITSSTIFEDEIFYIISRYFHQEFLGANVTDRIHLELNLLESKKEKLSYLISEVQKLNVFDLSSLHIGYWELSHLNRISIGPECKYNLYRKSKNIHLGWITGDYDHEYPLFEFKKNFFKEFENDIHKFFVYEYCMFQIKKLKAQDDDGHSKKQSKNDTKYEGYNIKNVVDNINREPLVFKNAYSCELFFYIFNKSDFQKVVIFSYYFAIFKRENRFVKKMKPRYYLNLVNKVFSLRLNRLRNDLSMKKEAEIINSYLKLQKNFDAQLPNKNRS